MNKREEHYMKLLEQELAEQQALEFRLKSDRSAFSKTIRKFMKKKSLYDDPENIDALMKELKEELSVYLEDAHIRGRLMGKDKLNQFLESSERWERSKRQMKQIERLSDKQASKRLKLAFDELQREGDLLKTDIELFKRNAEIAGFSKKEILKQLQAAGEDAAGLAAGFEKRAKSVATAALRREQSQSQLDAFREEYPDDTEYEWITVSTKPCPDCQARAGAVLTLKEWMELGIPGSGRTICKQFCMCLLMPKVVADEMFPTVKEFIWNSKTTVLTTAEEAKILRNA